jgi:RNA polymerase sigma-32 factor
MNIEGQFVRRTSRARRELATFVKDRIGDGYRVDVRRFEMLEKGQEYKLAKRWREQGDRDAGHQLVTSHLRLAVKVAMGYRGYDLPISEIISEGNVGLMQALNRFEPERGFRFATYAIWWIRASIQDYILRSWSLVKIGTTANQKKLFFKLRAAKRKLSALESGGDLHPDQVTMIAKSLNVAEQEVVDMNRRLAGDTSLNAPVHEEGEPDELQTYLNDRERRIFEARHLVDEPLTLEDLALEFRVSRERIRQIEARAFEKVRRATRKHIAEAQSTAAMLAQPPGIAHSL